MSRLLVFAATASLLSVTGQAALSQGVHEHPESKPGTSVVTRVEVRAGSVYDSHDLANNGMAAGDRIWVTKFPSSGMIDGPSRDD
ncbi:hypothetical protein [Paracoccus benzoatiresistens]|uniref:Uncharacterized protein n=1 Tax=Paracoccus benzoatiresistens TaxID=2997341 RepID=A0ABT4J0R3_9RHOB|nr:hypothetical protein [Paracoccus sp. EF6]MCZ0960709.1 hypothetical protein [Paracoccus sp. EF6]